MNSVIEQDFGLSNLTAFLDEDGDLILDQDGDGIVINKKGAQNLIQVLQDWVSSENE